MRINDSSIRVNRHTCIACGICVERCIMDNLRLSVAPCRQVCPLEMNCQGFIRLLAQGQEKEALGQVLLYGPLLKIIATSCTAPCENACSRKKNDGAVHILELERYLAEKYASQLSILNISSPASGRSIVIIGADIAALACAMRGRQAGHIVVVIGELEGTTYDEEVVSLQNAGVTFSKEPITAVEQYDAIIVTKPAYGQNVGIDIENVNSVYHQVEGKIFCVDSGKIEKGLVYAIAEAFETMASVERFLKNEPVDWGRGLYSQDGGVKQYKMDIRVGTSEPRAAVGSGEPIFDSETAKKQAGRCYGCGRAFDKNQTCWYCLPCELECPQQALEVRIPYLIR